MANVLNDDTALVLEILEALKRGPQDPDTALAAVLSDLADPRRPAKIDEALSELTRDAHPNSD